MPTDADNVEYTIVECFVVMRYSFVVKDVVVVGDVTVVYIAAAAVCSHFKASVNIFGIKATARSLLTHCQFFSLMKALGRKMCKEKRGIYMLLPCLSHTRSRNFSGSLFLLPYPFHITQKICVFLRQLLQPFYCASNRHMLRAAGVPHSLPILPPCCWSFTPI